MFSSKVTAILMKISLGHFLNIYRSLMTWKSMIKVFFGDKLLQAKWCKNVLIFFRKRLKFIRGKKSWFWFWVFVKKPIVHSEGVGCGCCCYWLVTYDMWHMTHDTLVLAKNRLCKLTYTAIRQKLCP